MNKKREITIVVIVSAITIICLFAGKWMLDRCFWWNCSPKRHFTLFDIKLPAEYFPSGVDLTIHPDREIRSVEEAYSNGHWVTGKYIYNLYRFATQAQAKQWYVEGDISRLFTFHPENAAGDIQEILDYDVKYANEFDIACGYSLEDYKCIFQARYVEHVIFFSGSVGDTSLNKDDFLGIIEHLDELLGSYLE